MHSRRARQDSAVVQPRWLKTVSETLAAHHAVASAIELLERAVLGTQSFRWTLAVAASVTLARIDLSALRKDQEFNSAA